MFVYYDGVPYWVDYYQDSSFVDVDGVSLNAVKSEDLDLFSLYAPWYDGSIESLNSAGFGDIGSVSATGSGSLPAITLAAITGSADNSMALNGNGSGALAPITLNAMTGAASGNANGTGSLPSSTLTAFAGGANVSATGTGVLPTVSLAPISGGASGDAVGAGVLPQVALTVLNGSATSSSPDGTGAGNLPSIALTAITGGAGSTPVESTGIQPVHGYSFENDRRLLKARRDKEAHDKLSFTEQLAVIKSQIAQTDTEAAKAFVNKITALVPKQAVKQSIYAIDYLSHELVNQSDDGDDEAIALIIAALL